MVSATASTSLRVLSWHRILDGMVRHVLCGGGHQRYLVLVTDKWTLPLLERVCHIDDLLKERIALVESIDSPREALPLDAVYFLAPRLENMDRLVEELSAKSAKYRSSHIFFTHRLEDPMLHRLAQTLEAVVKISSFAELNLSMLAYDDRSFHLQDHGDSLKGLLGIASPEAFDLKQAGCCLATLFATLGQEPRVLCAASGGAEGLCERLAREVCIRLEEMEARGGAVWRGRASSEVCSLLIVDRSVDWVPLLLHDFGYEALLFDLLGGQGASLSDSRFTFTDRSDGAVRRVVLGEETDELWNSYRHMATYAVNDRVVQEVKDWSRKESSMRLARVTASTSSASSSSTQKMVSSTLSTVQSLPEHKDRFRKLEIHSEICARLQNIVTSKRLIDLATLEQDMATGVSRSGVPLNPKSIERDLLMFLQDPTLDNTSKLRILMLCEATKALETSAGSGQRLAELAAPFLCAEDLRRLQKFVEVVRRYRSQDAERRRWSRSRRPDAEPGAGSEPVSPRRARLCRWQPKIASLIGDVAGTALPSQIRCLRGDVSVAGRAPGSSVAIFVVGGITLPEIRAAHEAAAAVHGLEAYVGGSCLLTPNSLLEACEAFRRS
ncbi:sec1 [Symbiodinium natans]|uniref:Sec1 protein n=1 Tax=Symbiodinium natans TaxID=878477 RepID=A0A812NLA6_9DINO|nr:sec1 [Symbiodinium natans]